MRILRRLLLALLFPVAAFATCTGSSPSWTCPMDANMASLRNLINGTQAGLQRKDTISVSNGTATMTSVIVPTKGVTILCPGGSCVITLSGSMAFDGQPDSTAISNSSLTFPCSGCEIIKIDGFTLDGSNSQDIFIKLEGASGVTGTKPYCCYVLSHNTIRNGATGSSNGAIEATTPDTNGQLRAVISHNTFDRIDIIMRNMSNDDTGESANTAFNGPLKFDGTGLGTSDNSYFEDNTIQYSSSFSGGNPGWTESGQGGRVVQRYNTFNMANATTPQEFNDVHGFQNWTGSPGSGQTGTMLTERYGNSYSNVGQFRCVDYRGGEGLVFDNLFTGSGGCSIDIYGMSATHFCPSFISPSPTNYNPLILAWFFNNTMNGTEKAATNTYGGTFECTIAENNGNALSTVGASSQGSWWNLNTGSCTGSGCTQGIGRGTTAPTGPCTKGTGYWVASTATPTTSSSVIQGGKFYVCTATNTWTLYYQPFTYPHPLVATGSGAVSLAPASPLNFGGQIIARTSPSFVVTLTNSGTATLNITSIGLTGGNSTDFAVTANTCGLTLAASASCNVSVTFTPPVLGSRTTTLRFTTDAATSPDNYTLNGSGIALFPPNVQMAGTVQNMQGQARMQ